MRPALHENNNAHGIKQRNKEMDGLTLVSFGMEEDKRFESEVWHHM